MTRKAELWINTQKAIILSLFAAKQNALHRFNTRFHHGNTCLIEAPSL